MDALLQVFNFKIKLVSNSSFIETHILPQRPQISKYYIFLKLKFLPQIRKKLFKDFFLGKIYHTMDNTGKYLQSKQDWGRAAWWRLERGVDGLHPHLVCFLIASSSSPSLSLLSTQVDCGTPSK